MTRLAEFEDLPALRRIWTAVFGDDDADAFFTTFFDPGLCVCAVHDDKPVAAAYLLPAGNLICDNKSIPCAMIYAVATLPRHRGRGYGSAVTRDLIPLGRASGYPAVVLCPSEDSLFDYYSKRTEMVEWFYAVESRYSYVNTHSMAADLIPVGCEDYGALRETLLEPFVHIEAHPRILEYQSVLCKIYGGGFFCMSSPIPFNIAPCPICPPIVSRFRLTYCNCLRIAFLICC